MHQIAPGLGHTAARVARHLARTRLAAQLLGIATRTIYRKLEATGEPQPEGEPADAGRDGKDE